MTAPSAKSLFRATRGRKPRHAAQADLIADLPEQRQPDTRRAHDFYPTAQPEPIRSLLHRDGARIRAAGKVWEPAVGAGDLAREIEGFGLRVIGSDLIDRGHPGTIVRSFYDWHEAPARAIITNPPFCEINARDGRGKWLRHQLDMPGWDYLALLLSWDWPAARINGLGEILDATPFSYCYLMRWKIDFTGDGSPPQRNAWYIWDKLDPRGYCGTLPEPSFRFLDRHDWRQDSLQLDQGGAT